MLRSLVAAGLERCGLPLPCLQPRPVVPKSHLLLPVTQYLGKFPSDALLVAAKEMSRDLKREPKLSSCVLPTRSGVEARITHGKREILPTRSDLETN